MNNSGSNYDLLLQGGRLIDPAQKIDDTMDVAIRGGIVARVAKQIPAGEAKQTVNVQGLIVTPGIIDLHTHLYSGCGFAVTTDALAVRSGVTTMVDAGTAGWKTFEAFKATTIDTVKTRVLAFLNIAGCGMTDREQDLGEMDPLAAAAMIQRYPNYIVGLKSAHYSGAGFEPIDHAVHAGRLSSTPVMVDFWVKPTATYEDLLLKHLRPGDMHTHFYARQFPLLDRDGKVQSYVWKARERGVLFDVGHGSGSFWFRIAVPAVQQGFVPDSISTDLHTSSALLPDAIMATTMSKFLNMGLALPDVIRRSTANPARQILRPELGTLAEGACADVAVFSLREGEFGFVDSGRARLNGTVRLECQMTIRAGEVVWDMNGLSWPDWQSAGQYDYVGLKPLPRHDWPA